jgi:hypothetical protein
MTSTPKTCNHDFIKVKLAEEEGYVKECCKCDMKIPYNPSWDQLDETPNLFKRKLTEAANPTTPPKKPKTNCNHPEENVILLAVKKEGPNQGRLFKKCNLCKDFIGFTDNPKKDCAWVSGGEIPFMPTTVEKDEELKRVEALAEHVYDFIKWFKEQRAKKQ